MNRFEKGSHLERKMNITRISILFFCMVLAFFLYAILTFGSASADRQEAALQNAIEKDIMNCYALEGFYPPSLAYLEEHYGLLYNKDMFFADYQPIGSNIMPSVTIIRKGADNESKIGK